MPCYFLCCYFGRTADSSAALRNDNKKLRTTTRTVQTTAKNLPLFGLCRGEFGFCEAVEFAEVGVEVGETRTDGALLLVVAGEGVGGLEAVAGDAGYGDLILPDAAVGVEARGDCGGDAAGGLGEDAFGFGEFLDAGDDFYVGDVFGPASGIKDHTRGCGAVVGIADGEGAGDGVGALGNDVVSSLLDGGGDGRAAGGLGSEEADGFFFDEAEVDEFVEGFTNFADERAAGHGDDYVVGGTPA